jgi:hypothetical protein
MFFWQVAGNAIAAGDGLGVAGVGVLTAGRGGILASASVTAVDMEKGHVADIPGGMRRGCSVYVMCASLSASGWYRSSGR